MGQADAGHHGDEGGVVVVGELEEQDEVSHEAPGSEVRLHAGDGVKEGRGWAVAAAACHHEALRRPWLPRLSPRPGR